MHSSCSYLCRVQQLALPWKESVLSAAFCISGGATLLVLVLLMVLVEEVLVLLAVPILVQYNNSNSSYCTGDSSCGNSCSHGGGGIGLVVNDIVSVDDHAYRHFK